MMGYIEFDDNKTRSSPKIVIYTKWGKDDEILAHEMIHLNQVIHKISTRHTQQFYDLEKEILDWLKRG